MRGENLKGSKGKNREIETIERLEARLEDKNLGKLVNKTEGKERRNKRTDQNNKKN